MRTQKALRIQLVQPEKDVPILAIRPDSVLRITGWSKPTYLRHLPHLRSYHVLLPGTKRGTRLIDYEHLKRYLEQFAEGGNQFAVNKQQEVAGL
jgi:hypothetical protein